jgi:hypothetical protein
MSDGVAGGVAATWVDTDMNGFFAMLAEPFPPDLIRVRPQGNRQLSYITARTVMNRLDEVAGPGNWWDDYVPGENSVLCRLTIRLPNGHEVTKADAGGYAGMSDQGDDDKSGFSDAFKRAAVKFGIGRHLYGDGIPRFVAEIYRLDNRDLIQGGGGGHAPAGRQSSSSPQRAPQGQPQGQSRGGGDGDLPTNGRGLFAWAKKRAEQKGLPENEVVNAINGIGEKKEFPRRMVDWTPEQVRDALDAYLGAPA